LPDEPFGLVSFAMASDDYRQVNHANWEARVPLHIGPGGYGLDRYRDDPAFLSDVVTFDRPRLGDVAGLDVLHLQCHIGTDTLSLARMGANVTGLDFSGSALDAARSLFVECGADGTFVESDVYDAVDVLGAERFDLVYTGVGALCWLPRIDEWARVVAGLLRPGGRLFVRDCHPVLFTLDDERDDGVLSIEHSYFETAEGVRFETQQSYVEHEGDIESPATIEFNHGLAEIITAVLGAGMDLVAIEEHDSVPWCALPGLMELQGPNEWRLVDRPERVPLTFTLQARRA
jgi:SAM-dependent methyltransferase